MEFVNKTPLVAQLLMGATDDVHRIGMVVAKATFFISDKEEASPELDIENPYPIFLSDQETPLGILPRDDLPREKADVIVLGKAYAPGGRPVKTLEVVAQIGTETRRLVVFGDRFWLDRGTISEPKPFTEMELTYSRAYGGTAWVEIDKESFVMVCDPVNPLGKGFDALTMAQAMGELYAAPQGYPKLTERRPLPNIEDPQNLVTSWEDDPDPVCWTTVPLHFPFLLEEILKVDAEGGLKIELGAFQRAHPSMQFEELVPGTPIIIRGMTKDGNPVFCKVPQWEPKLAVVSDGDTEATVLDLKLEAVVILVEEGKYYVLFRSIFNFLYRPDIRRKASLFLERWQ